jgi:hypothetical protein
MSLVAEDTLGTSTRVRRELNANKRKTSTSQRREAPLVS